MAFYKVWSYVLNISILLSLINAQSSDGSYLIQIPKHVRPGFNVSFSAAVFESSGFSGSVEVTSTFASSDNSLTFSSFDILNIGETRIISLGKIPLDYAGGHDFKFKAFGTTQETGSNGSSIFSVKTSDFEFASKALTILIQTDKAIYKPGQIIKFRGLVLHPDLRPLDGVARFSVLDENGNVLLLNSNVPLDHGVVGGEFELHRDAPTGQYRIVYEALGYKEEISVTVKQYKLPKFKVEVESPTYIWSGSEGVTLKLKATYTYGKPVKGIGYLSGEIRHSWGGPIYYASYDSSPPFGPPPSREIKQSFQGFDGEVEVFISKEELTEIGWQEDSYSSLKLYVTGKVVEEYTDVEFEETVEIDLERTNIKVDVLYKPKTIKPGLTYSAMIKITEKDGKPLQQSDVDANNLVVAVSYSYPWRRTWKYDVELSDEVTEEPITTTTMPVEWQRNRESPTETYVLEIPSNGVVTFNLDARNDDFTQISVTPYTNTTERWSYESRFTVPVAKSPSKSFLQIVSTDLGSVSPGDDAHILIKTTDAVQHVRMMVLSRGSIINDEVVSYSEPFDYHFSVTHDMTPSVKVLASYLRDDGEVVADYLSLSVSLSLENQVQLSSSAQSVDAGDDVTINVHTSAGSYVGARAIDQSVLLLKSGNDITTERVAADLNGYTTVESDNEFNWWWWWPVPSGADDANEVFEKAGIIILTDANVYEDEPDYYYVMANVMYDIAEDSVALPELSLAGASPSPTPKASPRLYFPETWLWGNKLAGEDGNAQFNLQAPDTITSWILSVFSVSQEYGLGLTDPMKITVFRNFFVNLNVPLKVTRGEIVVIQAVVFNYFTTDLSVRLELETNDKFELVIPGDDFDIAGPVRDFVVPAEGAFSISFPVTMSSVGDIPITVKALSPLAADVLTRNIFVKPEGLEQCYSVGALIERSSAEEAANVEEFRIAVPSGAIPDSVTAKLFIYGDVMGSTANNLGSLLKEPTGCGEQNMLSFAPDVFVTKYLETAGRLDAETKEKAYKHFISGYQNQLNYRHYDGSYSAFGKSDASGSTWLTAFVAKCFAHASLMRPDLDEQLSYNIKAATTFLTEQKTPFGTFTEPGKVSHKAMQGGVDSETTMAAYVLITLKEVEEAGHGTDESVFAANQAQIHLEHQLESIENDMYALAITTYALQLCESNRVDDALNRLETLATTTSDGLTFWEENDDDSSKYSEDWRPPYYSPPSQEIEISAYALLTYARRGDIDSAVPVLKWLTSKRNDLGAYDSTQNTVIAIQAMSEIAKALGDDHDLSITARHDSNGFQEAVNIDNANFVVYNVLHIPADNGIVEITAEGHGVAVAQLSVCYNIPDSPFDKEPFDCVSQVSGKGIDSATVDFCCKLREGESDATGMFVFEVEIPSGFTLDIERERQRNDESQRVELVDRSANVYYDELPPRKTICANVELMREAMVANVKPVKAAAYDYYRMERRVTRSINLDDAGVAGEDACQVCGIDCAGCPGPRFGEWRMVEGCSNTCDDGSVSTWERDCIDPSRGTVLPMTLCTYALEETVEMRPCFSPNFPECPYFHHGLWASAIGPTVVETFGPPPSGNFGYLGPLQSYNMIMAIGCRRNPMFEGDRQRGIRGIPATYLGEQVGSVIPSVECGSSVAVDAGPTSLSVPKDLPGLTDDGFTLSFLLYVEDFSWQPKTQQIVTFGQQKMLPAFSFEKSYWRSKVSFRVRYHKHQYRVKDISSKLLEGKWTHIVLAFDVANGAKVYFNGEEKGRALEYDMRSPIIPSLGEPYTLFYGKDNHGASRGGIRAWVSSMDYWTRMFSAQEVQQVYNYFEPMIDVESDERAPTFSPVQWRQFAIEGTYQCYNDEMSLYDYGTKVESGSFFTGDQKTCNEVHISPPPPL